MRVRKKHFHRREYHGRKKLSDAWRKPKGLHSKVRRKEKHTIKMPSPGFKTPKNVRALHPSGKQEILVSNVKDLTSIDASTQAARISSKVGKKKMLQILEECAKKNIRVLNTKKPEQKIKEIKEELVWRKKARVEKKKLKELSQEKRRKEKERREKEAKKKEQAKEATKKVAKPEEKPEPKKPEPEKQRKRKTVKSVEDKTRKSGGLR